jgi:hypothetical protein
LEDSDSESGDEEGDNDDNDGQSEDGGPSDIDMSNISIGGDMSMVDNDPLSQIEASFAELSMDETYGRNDEYLEPEGDYSFMVESPTDDVPNPHATRFFDDTISSDIAPEAETSAEESITVPPASELGHPPNGGPALCQWGAPICHCLPVLDRIHQEQIACGRAPAAPFADYLEFEFAKWMVERDISQDSRDKLLKLPLVSV